MLYLIVDENGKPDHRWSLDPSNDFIGLRIIGPAILDDTLKPADPSWLVPDGDTFKFDPALKLLAKNADRAAKEKVAADKAQRKTIIKDLKKAKTVDDLKAVIEALAKEFGAEVE